MAEAVRASELVKAIQDKIEQHGDLLVCLQDADTGWLIGFGLSHWKTPHGDSPGCAVGGYLVITSNYMEDQIENRLTETMSSAIELRAQ